MVLGKGVKIQIWNLLGGGGQSLTANRKQEGIVIQAVGGEKFGVLDITTFY
jgi:hypothetical protein